MSTKLTESFGSETANEDGSAHTEHDMAIQSFVTIMPIMRRTGRMQPKTTEAGTTTML